MTLELVGAGEDFRVTFDEWKNLVFHQMVRARLSIQLLEQGLWIEEILLWRRAGQMNGDDSASTRFEVRISGQPRRFGIRISKQFLTHA